MKVEERMLIYLIENLESLWSINTPEIFQKRLPHQRMCPKDLSSQCANSCAVILRDIRDPFERAVAVAVAVAVAIAVAVADSKSFSAEIKTPVGFTHSLNLSNLLPTKDSSRMILLVNCRKPHSLSSGAFTMLIVFLPKSTMRGERPDGNFNWQ